MSDAFAQWRRVIQLGIFPCQFVFGVPCNVIVLIVLLSRRMRSRGSNYQLSFMAIGDLFFLFSMAAINLYPLLKYTNGTSSLTRNWFKMHLRFPCLAMANIASTCSIWFVVYVSVNRLLAVTHPLHTSHHRSRRRLIVCSMLIVIGSLMVNLLHHSTQYCELIHLNSSLSDLNMTTHLLTNLTFNGTAIHHDHMKCETGLTATKAVQKVIPFVLLFIVNTRLLCILQRQRAWFTNAHTISEVVPMVTINGAVLLNRADIGLDIVSSVDKRVHSETHPKYSHNFSERIRLTPVPPEYETTALRKTHSWPSRPIQNIGTDVQMSVIAARKVEDRHILVVEVCILCSYFITHLPSAVCEVIVVATFDQYPSTMGIIGMISNSLVVMGKSMNCVLFCMLSRSFRSELAAHCRRTPRPNRF